MSFCWKVRAQPDFGWAEKRETTSGPTSFSHEGKKPFRIRHARWTSLPPSAQALCESAWDSNEEKGDVRHTRVAVGDMGQGGVRSWRPRFVLEPELIREIYGEEAAEELLLTAERRSVDLEDSVELALAVNPGMGCLLVGGEVIHNEEIYMRLKYTVEVHRFKEKEIFKSKAADGLFCHIGNPVLFALLLCCSRGAGEGLPIGKLAGLQSTVVREILSYLSCEFSSLLDRDAISLMKLGWVSEWPKPSGIKVNMMPFRIGDPSSLPLELRKYWPVLQSMNASLTSSPRPRRELSANPPPPAVAYLTVDEGEVPAGESQRRPGLHTETPGVDIGGIGPAMGFDYHPWGMGWVNSREPVGGIYMASNVSGSTLMYDVEVREDKVGEIGDGDVGWLRSGMGEGVLSEAGAVYWMNDRVPHESMPLEGGGARQYVRVVLGAISVWFEEHSTKNPLCGVGEGVRVVRGNKFEPGR
mmetsp:Transcript_6900/g.13385  ORF Transcript_6900/g.13385 Transcript_6900/m.13385 type:complete len:470 (-) Transcript_6900:248-1657(-)